jgi:hypothetical protein
MIIRTWNVRALFERGKLKQVEYKLEKYKLDILGLNEVRWLGFGEQRMTNGGIFFYSGRDKDEDRNGVGILLIKKAKNSLIQWHPVSQRIITAHFKAKVQMHNAMPQ